MRQRESNAFIRIFHFFLFSQSARTMRKTPFHFHFHIVPHNNQLAACSLCVVRPLTLCVSFTFNNQQQQQQAEENNLFNGQKSISADNQMQIPSYCSCQPCKMNKFCFCVKFRYSIRSKNVCWLSADCDWARHTTASHTFWIRHDWFTFFFSLLFFHTRKSKIHSLTLLIDSRTKNYAPYACVLSRVRRADRITWLIGAILPDSLLLLSKSRRMNVFVTCSSSRKSECEK